MTHTEIMGEAIALSQHNIDTGNGGPFAAVVVKDGTIIARGANHVTTENDPTAHAEIVAIREACRVLGTFQLTGCTVYTTCEPCPMCLGALYWARPDRIYYANTRADAKAVGFDDDFIYDELVLPIEQRVIPMDQLMRDEALATFTDWKNKTDKVKY
jgi:tRNA(Arg) A34 adenosine deaminase TadA